MGIENSEQSEYEQPEEISLADQEKQEAEPTKKPKTLIFDTPFHADPETAKQALDDSGMQKEIPRGALSVATLLERRGFEASVVPMDAFLSQEFMKGGEERERLLKEFYEEEAPKETRELQQKVIDEAFFITKMRENLHRLIEEVNPQVIAFSYMFSPTERSIRAMVRYIRENFPDKTIVLGGNAVSFDDDSRETFLDPSKNLGADVIVNREGEWTMLDVVESLEQAEDDKTKLDLSQIPGISYWDGEKVVDSVSERKRGDPIEIGPLSYNKIILPEGVNMGDFNHYVLFARGCMGRCAFCTSLEMYRRVVSSIGLESYRQELDFVARSVHEKEGGEKTVGLLDDDLLLELGLDAEGNVTREESEIVERKTVFEIVEPILRDIHQRYPDIQFTAQARVGHLRENDTDEKNILNPEANTKIEKPDEVLRKMKEVGINLVFLGIENGSQEILDTSRKDTKIDWIKPACRKIKNAGIEVGAFWIVGLPGATYEREKQSLEFLQELIDEGLIDQLESHVFVPLPGSASRKQKSIVGTMKLDEDFETKRQSLFNETPTYEYIDPKTGRVVFSKTQITELFNETVNLGKKLK